MTDASETPAPVDLPKIAWMGGHPTIAEQEPGGTRKRRCIRCNTRGPGFHESDRCEPGMVVHLIDPEDIAAAPEAFDGLPWAEPTTIRSAHDHWRSRGFRIIRKPDGPTGEATHQRFMPCRTCNTELMRSGGLPVYLVWPPPPPEPVQRARGWSAR